MKWTRKMIRIAWAVLMRRLIYPWRLWFFPPEIEPEWRGLSQEYDALMETLLGLIDGKELDEDQVELLKRALIIMTATIILRSRAAGMHELSPTEIAILKSR